MKTWKIGRYNYKEITESESLDVDNISLFVLINDGDVIKFFKRVKNKLFREKNNE